MAEQTGFVAYYRVSTTKQGLSGLGLDAQRAAIARCIGEAELVAEFTEVESGRRSDRPQLDCALACARVHRIPVVVAKVDRLTRSVAFLSRLLEAGVEVRFADLPTIEGPTGRFILQQMASVAELEAGLISARTKAALVAARQRGKILGGNRGAMLTKAAQVSGRLRQQDKARKWVLDLAPIVRDLHERGVVSLTHLARALTSRRIPTPRGKAAWSPMQVRRLLATLKSFESFAAKSSRTNI